MKTNSTTKKVHPFRIPIMKVQVARLYIRTTAIPGTILIKTVTVEM